MSRHSLVTKRGQVMFQESNKLFYEYRPTIYIAAGLISALSLDNDIGQYSGALLVFMGVLIFNLRISNRSSNR